MNYIERIVSSRVLEAAKYFPALVVTGPRQVGKTTLLRHLFPEHNYVSLDRPLLAAQAEEDPEGFLAQYPTPVIVDEVQYAPSIFRFLKIIIDNNREKKGQFILTGSQKFTLMKGITESLAGRICIIELEGLSAKEIIAGERIKVNSGIFPNLMLKGGFPELWSDGNFPYGLFLDSYIATYLERDVKQVLAISNLRDFERFLRVCALRSSQELNKSVIAREVGVSVPTIGEWLSVLESLGQVFFLEPWHKNIKKRLVKAPKMYLADVSLMCALIGVSFSNILQSPMIGSLWETYVFAELRKELACGDGLGKLWYYRDQSQLEVDFILEKDADLTFLECKWTSSPNNNISKNLQKLERVFAKSEYKYSIKKFIISRALNDAKLSDVFFRSPISKEIFAS